jgi:hypothetical protein
MKITLLLGLCFSMNFLSASALGEERDPLCLDATQAGSLESTFRSLNIDEAELLARLVLAETESLMSNDGNLSCEKHFDAYANAIAWTLRSRVELSRRSTAQNRRFGNGWYGVIFKRNQYPSAVSQNSKFHKFFTCPQKSPRFLKSWFEMRNLTDKVTDGESISPLIISAHEISKGYSTITSFGSTFSKPASSNSPNRNNGYPRVQRVRGLMVDGIMLSDRCLSLFRDKNRD